MIKREVHDYPMTNFRSSPLMTAILAVAITASTNVASAAVWPSNDKVLDWIDAGWNAPWLPDGVSYVDDGFRAPLSRLMANRMLNDPYWIAAAAHALSTDPRLNQQGQSRSGESRPGFAGSASSANGNRGNAGSASGSVGGAGGNPGTSYSGITPTDGRLLDREAGGSTLLPGDSSNAPGTGAAEPDSPIAVVPLPASAFLLIAGLGVLVPLSRRRRI